MFVCIHTYIHIYIYIYTCVCGYLRTDTAVTIHGLLFADRSRRTAPPRCISACAPKPRSLSRHCTRPFFSITISLWARGPFGRTDARTATALFCQHPFASRPPRHPLHPACPQRHRVRGNIYACIFMYVCAVIISLPRRFQHETHRRRGECPHPLLSRPARRKVSPLSKPSLVACLARSCTAAHKRSHSRSHTPHACSEPDNHPALGALESLAVVTRVAICPLPPGPACCTLVSHWIGSAEFVFSFVSLCVWSFKKAVFFSRKNTVSSSAKHQPPAYLSCSLHFPFLTLSLSCSSAAGRRLCRLFACLLPPPPAKPSA
jgi:hypothetical protein